MKTTLLTTLFVIGLCLSVSAQETIPRNIQVKHFYPDSVHLPLNADYMLIEDACAKMIRRTRFNDQHRYFMGSFTDVNPQNPEQVLGQGTYTEDGKKTGLFTLYFPNGKLRAQGHFSNNQFAGDWSTYYEDGSPKAKFTVTDGLITVQQAWSENGSQIVTDGTGTYNVVSAWLTWSGDIRNGRPDGTWRAVNPLESNKAFYLTEKYKNGQFQKGTGPLGPYTDASRIEWFNPKEFPFLFIEEMYVSSRPCGFESDRNKIVGARYAQGLDAYSRAIGSQLNRALSGVNMKLYNHTLEIKGQVAENGRLVSLTYQNAFDERIASAIIKELRHLPALEPATSNGNPIRQDIEFIINIRPSGYNFKYRFLPIDPKST
ncbi:hypothetical protein H7F15_09375 [Pontibacter sp. Tf4]|uniref:toxin-antitoxin system YwqK family antitoxin n=1 Tax=Pontibacter sp. Tf4 TaxID=2761620 RepID=UPI001628A5E6|nr:hypothetical protein [Pontibacter sp. Tf4]MBB6611245.1 hypothetical protein [Pontibacter sp. Tf4]